jgi:hypothetical protein
LLLLVKKALLPITLKAWINRMASSLHRVEDSATVHHCRWNSLCGQKKTTTPTGATIVKLILKRRGRMVVNGCGVNELESKPKVSMTHHGLKSLSVTKILAINDVLNALTG